VLARQSETGSISGGSNGPTGGRPNAARENDWWDALPGLRTLVPKPEPMCRFRSLAAHHRSTFVSATRSQGTQHAYSLWL
jgi:hypothetical protein